MRKKLIKLLLALSTAWLLFATPLPVNAEDSSAANNLVTNLKFDKKTRILSGDTAPDANIYLSFSASYFPADGNGHFEIAIPADVDASNVLILDLISGESTETTYQFKDEPATSVEPSNNNVQAPTGTGTTSSSNKTPASKESQTKESTAISTSNSKAPAKKKKKAKNSNVIWFIGAIILVAALIVVIFIVTKRKKRKH